MPCVGLLACKSNVLPMNQRERMPEPKGVCMWGVAVHLGNESLEIYAAVVP